MEPNGQLDLEQIRQRLAKRRGVDIPTANGQRVLLIPRSVIHNKHRDTHFIVIMSNAGFYEFHPDDLRRMNPFKLIKAGFRAMEATAVVELLLRIFQVTPIIGRPPSTRLPCLEKTGGKSTKPKR